MGISLALQHEQVVALLLYLFLQQEKYPWATLGIMALLAF